MCGTSDKIRNRPPPLEPVLLPACRFILAIVLALGAGLAGGAPRWGMLAVPTFQRLTQEEGLPGQIATAVAEDGDGFVWVGTPGGLARWDGYRFRVFRADARTPGSLPDNLVQVLHGDAAGRLWVGTSAAGLARYDPGSERFVAYPVGGAGLSHVNIRALADDGSGGLWVGTERGLDHLNPATGAIRHLPPVVAEGGAVAALLRDRSGALWVGTPQGLFRRDASAQRFVAVPLPAGAGEVPLVQSLCEDGAGRLWVGTLRDGAFVVERPGAAARRLPGSEAEPALQRVQVRSIVEVRPGEVWIGTDGSGILAVDAENGELMHIRHRPTLALSLAADTVRWLHRDRAGLVWAATTRGLSRHDPRQQSILTVFGSPERVEAGQAGIDVSWVLPMADGRLWLGTHEAGVEIVDPDRGVIGALRPDGARPETALPDDYVLAMEPAPDGSIFIGTKRGLYRADGQGRGVRRVTLATRDPEASTWALRRIGDTLWIGGQNDGLWRLDLATGRARPVLRADSRLTDERVVSLAPAADGGLWVGTRYGLNRVDIGRETVLERLLPGPQSQGGPALAAGFVTAILTDRHGRLWVGTFGGGVQVQDGRDSAGRPRLHRIDALGGLPEDTVNALLEDDAGRIWTSTDNGLAVIDPTTLAVRSLRRAEGVAFATYWTGSAGRTQRGELVFGALGGMTIVRPERLHPSSYRPPVVLTEVQVGGRELLAGRFAHGRETLVVPPDGNSLQVEFAAVDYSAPERIRYAYRLEGFDGAWIETDASRRLAAYTNLPPGSYRLQLRGSNRDGEWSGAGLSLPVEVLPAWHQTLWFRAVAGVAVLLAVLLVVQQRTRLLRLRQAELEAKVRERTAELEAMSLALAEKSRILQQVATTDPLTGLHNRRYLTEHIETDIAASLRRAAEAGPGGGADTDNVFYLVDADHFKRVNDLYGHAAGDAVLVQFGRRLRSVLRESDHLVRWGGEEFLAVARETDRRRAEELAERIRQVVADSPFVADDGHLLAVTCSIGFATLPFAAADPKALDWHEVVRLADVALMAAKGSGRNAWVGVAAGPAMRAPGLAERLQAAPAQTLAASEIALSSNRPLAAVLAGLRPPGAGGVPAATPLLG